MNIREKYQEIQLVSNSTQTEAMQNKFGTLSEQEIESYFAQDNIGGGVFVFDHPDFPGVVMEIVAGIVTDDSIACMYAPSPIFGDKVRLMNMRKELIATIESKFVAAEGCLAFKDAARNRHVLLAEMPTAQLIDMITAMEQTIITLN